MMRAGCLVLILAVSLLSGCAGIQAAGPGLKCPTVKIELFFGLSIPGGGNVTESDWKDFTESQITPRFPDGLTVYDASGQWRVASGAVILEGTKVAVLITGNSREKFLLIEEIREAYRKRFWQESVLLVSSCVKATF
jgi:hypothetical protein